MTRRLKIRYLYYLAYMWMGPLTKLIYWIAPSLKSTSYIYRTFFRRIGIDYTSWRIMMEDMKHRDKSSHNLFLYMTQVLLICLILIIIILCL